MMKLPIIDSKEESAPANMELRPGMILCPQMTFGYGKQVFFGVEEMISLIRYRI